MPRKERRYGLQSDPALEGANEIRREDDGAEREGERRHLFQEKSERHDTQSPPKRQIRHNL